MKLISLICLNALIVFPLWANDKPKGELNGLVVDGVTSEPILFAPVTLLNQDSTLITGMMSDELGAFSLKGIEFGDYIVKVDFIGYKARFIDVSVSSENPKQDLGTITLESSEQLKGLEIKEEGSAYRVEIDKKVYDPSKNPINAGGTGLDVMRNVPSVDVDADDNISLRGDQNVNILVNGRPVAVPISQLLKQIPASSIEEIEIITNPSAKYDPEGTSGIINIILKKNENKGFNGNLSMAYGRGQYDKYNGGINLNFLSEKVNINAGLNVWKGEFGYGGSMSRNIYANDTINTLISTDEGVRDNFSPMASLGIDYFADDHNTLYISASGSKGSGYGHREVNYQFLSNNELLQSSERIGDIDSEPINYEFNGGWQHKFKKPGHTLDIDGRYSFSDMIMSDEMQEIFSDSYGQVYPNSALQNTTTGVVNELINTRIDYINPITDSLKLELGTHFTGRSIESSFFSESFNYNSDAFEADTSLNNDFDYVQDVYAVYATLAKQFKHWSVKGGLRVEQTLNTSELVTTNETFNNDYLSLFPSLFFNYGKTPYDKWQLSYSRRINRPEVEEINPFTTYDDPYTLQRGNPFLEPEFIHVLELGHSLIKEKFTLNSSVYYRFIKDQKRRYLSLLDGGISQVSYDNLASSQLKGIELIAGYNFTKMINSNATLNFWHNSVDDPDAFGSNSNHGWSLNLSTTARFKKGMTTQLNMNYRGKMRVIQGVIEPAYGIDLAFRKQILKNRGSLGIRVQDILKTRNFNFTSDELNGYDFESKRYWESRQVWVSFNYFFGKQIKAKHRKRISDRDASDDTRAGDMQ